MKFRRTALVAVVAALIVAGSGAAAPMILLSGTGESNREIVRPGARDALPVDGRLFVQELSATHLFAGDADRPYRVDHVSTGALLAQRTGAGMAAYLKARIDSGDCVFPAGRGGCTSGLIFVDEVDKAFSEPAPYLATKAWTGPRAKWPKYVPRPRAGQGGFELSRAMTILSTAPYPSGGTYAERIHFYIAPTFVQSIGIGRGRYYNLGRDGRPHYRSYEGVRRALRLSGGVWLEMYHFTNATRTRYPSSVREWTRYPARWPRYLVGPGAAAGRPALTAKLHFFMTRGTPQRDLPAVPSSCRSDATPQSCQFELAALPQNAAILANGVGAHRMDGSEAEWRGHVKRLFFPELG